MAIVVVNCGQTTTADDDGVTVVAPIEEVAVAEDEMVVAKDEVVVAEDEVIVAEDEVNVAEDEVIVAEDEVVATTISEDCLFASEV